MSDADTRPLYLLADSQPLFWKSGAFLRAVCEASANTKPNVAYIGASNGDSADAQGIFAAAFEQVATAGTHWVRAAFSNEDRAFLDTADVIVLGVSAGAVQFGKYAAVADSNGGRKLLETFGLLDVIVDVHDEKRDWQALSSTIQLLEGAARGIGIPHGAALVVHSDGTFEPVGRAVEEFVLSGGRLRRAVLLADIQTADEVVR